MPRFESLPDGGIRLELDREEATLLRRLTGEMKALLAGEQRSDDPVLTRLFPAAYEAAEDEATYRDLVGDELHAEKLEGVEAVERALGRRGGAKVELGADEVDRWLAFLTDLRLAIGVRLDVDEEKMGAELDPDDPETPSLAVLHWLGWVQEGILRKLMA